MASNAKPKKKRRLRSWLRRLFSSSSGTRDGRDYEHIAQDSQALVPDLSLLDNLKGVAPPTEEVLNVPAVGSQRRYHGGTTKREASSMGPSASMSVLSKAHHVNVGGNIQIDSSQHVHNSNAQERSIAGWKMLLKNIAPNTFYNSAARFDPPKCDEDTRVEVTSEIMDWISDRDSPQRLLCMTGAAGAGKSALQQTIAERCADSGTLGCAIFFSSHDPTRNTLSRIIPTIAYQLGKHDYRLRDLIGEAVEEDPPIFTRTIKTQMNTLVVGPFQRLQANVGFDPGSFPHAVLIDGIDECGGEERQAELLSTIKHCLLDNDLPFRIFIASRPEWAIRSALNSETEGYLHPLAYHIQLSDKYDATDDIRRYLWWRLQGIGRRSHDPRARSNSWPSVEDIEKLTIAASGQFVYAATIVKYVSERHSSPVDRLQTVVDWTPEKGRLARPFEALDALYAGILSAAKEQYEAVDTHRGRNFLLLLRAHQINSDRRVGTRWDAHDFDEILDLERNAHEILVSDLHSLVVFHQQIDSPVFAMMRFYHRSFSEFLDNETRSGKLFIAGIQVQAYVLETVVQGINRFSLEPSRTRATSRCMSDGDAVIALTSYSNKGNTLSGQQILALAHNGGWRKVDQWIQKGSAISSFWGLEFLAMIFVIMQRLKDELKELGLAGALRPYYNKWREIVKTDIMESTMQSFPSRLPPEEPEEGEREEGEEPQEGSDSSSRGAGFEAFERFRALSGGLPVADLLKV